MKSAFISLLAAVMAFAACNSPGDMSVASPDGKIVIAVAADSSGTVAYRAVVDGRQFVAPSSLGFDMEVFRSGEADRNGVTEPEKVSLDGGFEVASCRHTRQDYVWTQPWGENKTIRCRYNEMAVGLSGNGGFLVTVRFRVFDDGFGFRYEVECPGADSLRVMEEKTMFSFDADADSWSIPANFDTYELDYRALPLGEVPDANTPVTFRTADRALYGSVHEAALEDYPEMTLTACGRDAGAAVFESSLAPWPDGVKARFAGSSFKTPWRTVQVGRRAVDLVNSALILNLNEPCALEDTDWIKPMKYVGIWWGMHTGVQTWKMDDRHGATTENALEYIDFAAANNIQGVVFEGWNEGWESWGGMQSFDFTKPYADFDVARVMEYAREKGVSVIGHHETGANIPNYERQLEYAYEWSQDMGMHYIKTGYAGGVPGGHKRHGQYAVRHYRKVVETAAAHEISLDVHEPIKETGIRRTYPNMMTLEGAKGMEWNAWSAGNPPVHYVTLPFTRLLSGPMDYTPGVFDVLLESTKHSPLRQKWNDLDRGDSRVNTTLACQIACWVVLYSPLQMASDMIENYEGHPAFQFFRDFDADCDWSRALDGEPGEYISVVRRAGDRYFLGAITGDSPRTLQVPLDFLGSGKEYRAVIYADGPDADWKTNPCSYTISEKTVSSDDVLEVKMASGGGQAVVFFSAD